MLQIKETDEDSKNPWELMYFNYYDKENIGLRQLVYLSDDHILFTVSFFESKQMIVISNKIRESQVLQNTIPDPDTIFASGCSRDSIFYFENTEKKGILGILTGKGISVKKELRVYIENNANIDIIVAAVYLKIKNALLLLFSSGHIRQFFINNQEFSIVKTIAPIIYTNIYITECERFVILLGERNSYIFTYNLDEIYMDYKTPTYVGIKNGMIYFITLNELGEVSVDRSEIDAEKKIVKKNSRNTVLIIDSTIRRSVLFTTNSISEMFSTNNFK